LSSELLRRRSLSPIRTFTAGPNDYADDSDKAENSKSPLSEINIGMGHTGTRNERGTQEEQEEDENFNRQTEQERKQEEERGKGKGKKEITQRNEWNGKQETKTVQGTGTVRDQAHSRIEHTPMCPK